MKFYQCVKKDVSTGLHNKTNLWVYLTWRRHKNSPLTLAESLKESEHSNEQELWLNTQVALSDRTGTVIKEIKGVTKY